MVGKSKVKVGDKIVPNMGSYRGKTLVVTSMDKVICGSKKLGTRKGMVAYMASPSGSAVGIAYYARGDFKVKVRKRRR